MIPGMIAFTLATIFIAMIMLSSLAELWKYKRAWSTKLSSLHAVSLYIEYMEAEQLKTVIPGTKGYAGICM